MKPQQGKTIKGLLESLGGSVQVFVRSKICPDPCNGGLSCSLFSSWSSKAKVIKLPFKYSGRVILKKTEPFSEVFLFRV